MTSLSRSGSTLAISEYSFRFVGMKSDRHSNSYFKAVSCLNTNISGSVVLSSGTIQTAKNNSFLVFV